jgi:hypothetical protein
LPLVQAQNAQLTPIDIPEAKSDHYFPTCDRRFLTMGLVMDEKPDKFREAVGVFDSANELQSTIEELLSSGFHRADLNLLAGEDAMHEKLSGGFVEFPAVANDPDLSRTACLSREAIGEAQGGVVGGLMYARAIGAAGAVVMAGGVIFAATVAAPLVGAAEEIVGRLLAKWLGDSHAQHLQRQLDRGGLLLWVRTRDANAEDRAINIFKRHSSPGVHVHTGWSAAA